MVTETKNDTIGRAIVNSQTDGMKAVKKPIEGLVTPTEATALGYTNVEDLNNRCSDCAAAAEEPSSATFTAGEEGAATGGGGAAAAGGEGAAAAGEGLMGPAFIAQFAGSTAVGLTSNFFDGLCQTNQMKEQAQQLKEEAILQAQQWNKISEQEDSLASTIRGQIASANNQINSLNTQINTSKVFHGLQLKAMQKKGAVVVVLVFFALLVKWVFVGPSAGPFIGASSPNKRRRSSNKRRR